MDWHKPCGGKQVDVVFDEDTRMNTIVGYSDVTPADCCGSDVECVPLLDKWQGEEPYGQDSDQLHVCTWTSGSDNGGATGIAVGSATPAPTLAQQAAARTSAPTAAPTEPTAAPTAAPTESFATVLAGKGETLIWAPYGTDQPAGKVLKGYGTGREIAKARYVNNAKISLANCHYEQPPDCKDMDLNKLLEAAKLKASDRNIKAFCLNPDDVSFYLMSSAFDWVTFPSKRCPTEYEIFSVQGDGGEDSPRWTKYKDTCPTSGSTMTMLANGGVSFATCPWQDGGAPECLKELDTKGTWTCYKQYTQTDPDLCTKGGVCPPSA